MTTLLLGLLRLETACVAFGIGRDLVEKDVDEVAQALFDVLVLGLFWVDRFPAA